MFYYVNGELAHLESGVAVIDCGGVGYKLTISLLTSESLGAKKGETVRLYTHLSVREDGVELFGFASDEELEVFKLLTSVSGVGPKAGMSLLSILPSDRLLYAICTEDTKTLAKAPGIGGKTAARIVLELKDKLAKAAVSDPDFSAVSSGAAAAASGNVPKAVEALGVLGYTPAEVAPVLAAFDSSLPVEQLIAMTLRQMGRQ